MALGGFGTTAKAALSDNRFKSPNLAK